MPKKATGKKAMRIGDITPKTSDATLAELQAVGLDFNDEDAALATWIGRFTLTTKERIAFVRRLMAHGFSLDATRVREILESLHDDVAAEEDIGVALIDLANEHGLEIDEDLIHCVLDRLPVAALERLAAAGATFSAGVRVKSSAPDSAKKTAWLAKRRGKAAKPARTAKMTKATKATKRIPWKQFSRLDGADLTEKVVIERLVGDTELFPDAPRDSFETSDGGGPRPAGHEFSYGDQTHLEYRVMFLMNGAYPASEEYRAHGQAMFDAILAAITTLHGKPVGGKKSKQWKLADRHVALGLSLENGQRPSAKVTLTTNHRP